MAMSYRAANPAGIGSHDSTSTSAVTDPPVGGKTSMTSSHPGFNDSSEYDRRDAAGFGLDQGGRPWASRDVGR